jgi:hypothetical protein
MKIILAVLQVALILLLSAGPLLAQGDSKEARIFDSDATPKQSDPDSGYPAAGHDFLDVFETFARASQAEVLASGEIEIKEKLLVPASLKDSPVGVSIKDPPDIGEMTNQEVEASSEGRETELKREVPVTGYVAWRRKPIGQRALELARIESDIEILDILHKEYGKERLDQWLGISRGKEQIDSENNY